MVIEKLLDSHFFVFNPENNGEESLSLTTRWISNGDPITEKDGIYTNQDLILQSYCNSAIFNLCGISITPDNLRKLANELESHRNRLTACNNNGMIGETATKSGCS